MISAQNSVSSVSSSPLPGMTGCQVKMDEELKNAVHARSQAMAQQNTESPQHQGKSQMSSNQGGQTTEMQLKYENDKLKFALAQSSANAKKWEVWRIIKNLKDISLNYKKKKTKNWSSLDFLWIKVDWILNYKISYK